MSETKPDRQPKYQVGQRVYVQGWTRSDFGTITGMEWIYHHRLYEYTWGYSCAYENGGPGLTFIYVPEAYIKPTD